MPKTTLLRKQVTPVGSIQSHAGGTAPDGYLICDGSIVTIADYPNLYAAIGTSWGYGNNDGLSFHLPDLRGRFLRGKDNATGRDPNAGARTAANAGGNTGDNVGSVQDDAMQGHRHGMLVRAEHGNGNGTAVEGVDGAFPQDDYNGSSIQSPTIVDGANGTPRIAPESRPKNAAVNYIIKAV